MTRIPISPAAAAFLRVLCARAAVPRDRILLTDAHSIDWQSLTFTGERHHIGLRVTGPGSRDAVHRMCAGLDDAEFSIPGLLVADIGLSGTPAQTIDGSTELTIEALTISED
jgi:hypothetical protein